MTAYAQEKTRTKKIYVFCMIFAYTNKYNKIQIYSTLYITLLRVSNDSVLIYAFAYMSVVFSYKMAHMCA